MSISEQALKQHLTALGLLSDLLNGSTTDHTEANQVLMTLFNRSFLQGLKPWVGEKGLADVLMFAPHLITYG